MTTQPPELTSPRASSLPPSVRQHDLFNLISLFILNSLNLAHILHQCPFIIFWATTMAYFIADGLFVALVPFIVKSPRTIILHHLISGGLILIPLLYPAYHWCMSYDMLVEINTWLLIARRNVERPSLILESLFYITWVVFRLVLYPFLVYRFFIEWLEAVRVTGVWVSPLILAPLLQVFLMGLNVQWTLEMVTKMRAGGKMKML